jgi:hypothetical protein
MSIGHGQPRRIRATEVDGGRMRIPRGSSYRLRVWDSRTPPEGRDPPSVNGIQGD